MSNSFIIKGDIAYSKSKDELYTIRDGYIVCENGICQGAYDDFSKIPEYYNQMQLIDHTGKLIMPGMIDLHLHAPQYAFRGMHMDEELLDWLQQYTFKEEGKYSNLEYAEKAYSIFADGLRRSATTRAVIFATVHRKATEILMSKMEETGLISYVGKVNQDRFSPPELDERTAEHSLAETEKWLHDITGRFMNTRPIITPRFIPTCTDKLMEGLGRIAREHALPVQSHLSENPSEIETVLEFMPSIDFYASGYDKYDMLNRRTIMAHCIYSPEAEARLLASRGVFIAHCPSSNMNLRSGIAPIKKYMNMGMNIGLGSDVAGGESESIFEEIKNAIRVSKLIERFRDGDTVALKFNEAFWLATASGGSFFGSTNRFGVPGLFGASGKFEKGFEFDAIVIDDERQPHPQRLSIADRVERSIYLAMDRYALVDKYVKGAKIELA